ncbi:MAG: branched-chain amino acid transport system II carrier protein [Oligoflexales bacterium]|nr:branched-chain amino acid transport system II carrier protein [Oligoflexales bacterium]
MVSQEGARLPSGMNTIALGMAMFSMFFGAGNVVFPVLIGQLAQDKSVYAIMGLLITAVFVPFLGLISISLYNGDYFTFFKRLGTVPSWLCILPIMALIGPFAAIPRCIAISHSAMTSFIPDLSIPFFSFISCLVLYFFAYKKNRVMDLLAYVLTPGLLISLLVIITKGLLNPTELQQHDKSAFDSFSFGLIEGYNTMDLFGSFIFSSVILSTLHDRFPGLAKDQKKLLSVSTQASLIGMILLGLVYVGICFTAAYHAQELRGFTADKVLSQLALRLLGPYAGVVVCIAVSLACLTTAISLTLVFSEFTAKSLLRGRVSYHAMLILTLLASFFMANLKFSGIQALLIPILQILLPSFIVLSVLNLAHKVFGLTIVKIPVMLTLILSTYYYAF